MANFILHSDFENAFLMYCNGGKSDGNGNIEKGTSVFPQPFVTAIRKIILKILPVQCRKESIFAVILDPSCLKY